MFSLTPADWTRPWPYAGFRKIDLDVIAVSIDVGQPRSDDIIARALRNGALKAELIDAKEEFINEYVWTALKSNAMYQGVYPLSTSVARPSWLRNWSKSPRGRVPNT